MAEVGTVVRVHVVDDDVNVGGARGEVGAAPLNVPLDGIWDVAGLKSRLEAVCPSRPAPDLQRLVWRGRVLRDDESLDRLRSESGTLHLLVRSAVPVAVPVHVHAQAHSRTHTQQQQQQQQQQQSTHTHQTPAHALFGVGAEEAAAAAAAARGPGDNARVPVMVFRQHGGGEVELRPQAFEGPADVQQHHAHFQRQAEEQRAHGQAARVAGILDVLLRVLFVGWILCREDPAVRVPLFAVILAVYYLYRGGYLRRLVARPLPAAAAAAAAGAAPEAGAAPVRAAPAFAAPPKTALAILREEVVDKGLVPLFASMSPLWRIEQLLMDVPRRDVPAGPPAPAGAEVPPRPVDDDRPRDADADANDGEQ
jgi:hypothetical protein